MEHQLTKLLIIGAKRRIVGRGHLAHLAPSKERRNISMFNGRALVAGAIHFRTILKVFRRALAFTNGLIISRHITVTLGNSLGVKSVFLRRLGCKVAGHWECEKTFSEKESMYMVSTSPNMCRFSNALSRASACRLVVRLTATSGQISERVCRASTCSWTMVGTAPR